MGGALYNNNGTLDMTDCVLKSCSVGYVRCAASPTPVAPMQHGASVLAP